MAEPLTVVPALNTMILLFVLLAFGASVSQFSWVVQVVSRTVLLVLITIAWLSQPMSKIQKLVSQLWGHDFILGFVQEDEANNVGVNYAVPLFTLILSYYVDTKVPMEKQGCLYAVSENVTCLVVCASH